MALRTQFYSGEQLFVDVSFRFEFYKVNKHV